MFSNLKQLILIKISIGWKQNWNSYSRSFNCTSKTAYFQYLLINIKSFCAACALRFFFINNQIWYSFSIVWLTWSRANAQRGFYWAWAWFIQAYRHLFITVCTLIVAAQPSKLVNKVSKLFMAQETYVFTKYYYNFHSTEVINSILGVSESAILIMLSIHSAL